MDLEEWRYNFNREAEGLPHGDNWNLEFDYSIEPKRSQNGWKEYITQTSARFKCSLCKRSWSSDRVMVVFHMRLEGSKGTVKVRCLRQRCKECRNRGKSPPMEDPGVEIENLRNLMESLVTKIRVKCYKETPKGGEYVQKKLDNKHPHDSDNCEGCELGICTKE